MGNSNPFGVLGPLETKAGAVQYASLRRLSDQGIGAVEQLPVSIKILLESLLRSVDGATITETDVKRLANWDPKQTATEEIPFKPARVVLQDFTGVPALVDLAALRSALARAGGDPAKINPLIPCDLIIDHSLSVDAFGTPDALRQNEKREFERNRERYEFLRWGSQTFANFRLVPPTTGIIHQVNLEFLACIVMTQKRNGGTIAFPDTLVGTDSHTTMINGLGVLGWGVGGIEAEAVMLGQPIVLLPPPVIGFRLTGVLPERATATDLVLTITQILRTHGVVGKFVEFFGAGLSTLPLPDRATISNMCPEYGATAALFPVDAETLSYLALTGRSDLMDLVERYTKEQGLFRTDQTPDPNFTETLTLDLGSVEPSLAGPKRPQDRVALAQAKTGFQKALSGMLSKRLVHEPVAVTLPSGKSTLDHGSVVIAAITSCTNTSNPSVMVGAGLLAKKAVERGLSVAPHVKTSLAPGSQVVSEYLDRAGLTPHLEALGFHTVGYGCTTCIGQSGPLPEAVSEAVAQHDLVAVSVLSGNRNFEGRVHSQVRANYLASPLLVVAYALAGRMDLDLTTEPLGTDANGKPVYLKEIWPTQKEIADTVLRAVTAEVFKKRYAQVFEGTKEWKALSTPSGQLYDWKPKSTYVQQPPFFIDFPKEPAPIKPIENARVLIKVADSVTTDHISPAGAIPKASPAGQYLIDQGVEPAQFNSYGSRRGNDRVMARGTFANVRIRNEIAPGTEGWRTIHLPTGEKMSIFDAAQAYRKAGIPLLVLAGKEYGSGSSRDWAAKGPALLGIRAVIAESFERIHRSNLIGMGILPLEFQAGESAGSLELTGRETFSIQGLSDNLKPGQAITVKMVDDAGETKTITVKLRIDTPVEIDYYKNGGILAYVLRKLLKAG